MARHLLNQLTDKRIQAAKGPCILNDGGGLRCRVDANGRKAWFYRYQLNGKSHDIGLGNYLNVSLAEAREKAAEHRRLAKSKVDPLETKQASSRAAIEAKTKAKGGITFQQALIAYVKRQEASWTGETTKREWLNSPSTHAASLLNKPCEQITAQDIFDVLDPLWHVKNDLAARLRFKIERVLSDAYTTDIAHKYFNRDWVNPARYKHHLENRYSRSSKHVQTHYYAIVPADVCTFVSKLREKDDTVNLALELTLLCAVRPSMVRNATWSQIDLDKQLWVIPPHLMKNKRAGEPHVIPLPPRALQIINEMRLRYGTGENTPDAEQRWVFKGRGSDGRFADNLMRLLCRKLGYAGVMSPHGCRAVFKTWCNDSGIEDNLSEAILAHADGRVKAAYNRSDFVARKLVALTRWADFISNQQQSNVLPLFG